MRQVCERRDKTEARTLHAQSKIQRLLLLKAAGQRMRERLEQIQDLR